MNEKTKRVLELDEAATREVERLESELNEQRRRADALESERNAARSIARVLAHAYTNDNAPPPSMVDEALGFAIDQRAEKS